MDKEPDSEIAQLLKELRRLTSIFSAAATPIAKTDNSLVFKNDGIIIKAYRKGGYWPDKAVAKHIACEAASLDFFKGRIGCFHCPELCAAPTFFHDKSDRFVGLIQMTEMRGKPASSFLNWNRALDDVIYVQLGELIATLHDLGSTSCQISPYENGNYIMVPADTQDETLVQNIHIANYWFSRNKRAGYAHTDLHYGNLFLDSSGHNLTGCIDFAYAGLHDNPFLDLAYIQGPALSKAIEAYESIRGESAGATAHINLMLEFAKLSSLSLYVDYLADDPNKDIEFRHLKARFNKELNLFVARLG